LSKINDYIIGLNEGLLSSNYPTSNLEFEKGLNEYCITDVASTSKYMIKEFNESNTRSSNPLRD
jgi:hypothetical protein